MTTIYGSKKQSHCTMNNVCQMLYEDASCDKIFSDVEDREAKAKVELQNFRISFIFEKRAF